MSSQQFREQLAGDIEELMGEYLATKGQSMDEWYEPERDLFHRALSDFVVWLHNWPEGSDT